ncbi:MAG: PAS domain S-box protein [Phycisphaeraceae bacterium]|nr:PAS domain S-box protein [Phycisphaeraceae bacterium]
MILLAYSTTLPRRVLLILLLGILSIWGTALWEYHRWSIQNRGHHHMQQATDIATHFKRYETVLLGCRGLYLASNEVTQSEWATYVNSLQIGENYLALTDLAIIRLELLPSQSAIPNKINANSENWQAIVQQHFFFRDEHPHAITRFDMSKSIRHKLIDSAMNNNFACLPTIPTWQYSQNAATLLLPLFKKSRDKNGSKSRIQDLEGWIAVTVDLNIILVSDELHLPSKEDIKMLYINSEDLTGKQISLKNLPPKINGNMAQSTHDIAGSTWTIQITHQTASAMSLVLVLLNSIFIASTIISLLISSLLGASIASNQHAMQIIAIKSKALEDSEQRTRSILDTSNDAFFTYTSSGHIIDWSRQAQKLFGYEKHEIIGQILTQTLLPNHKQQNHPVDSLHNIFTGNGIGQRVELTAQDRVGKLFPVELSISSMQSPQGIAFNVSIHDITPRKQLETQLAHAQKLESIGGLAAGIAHEINTPTQYVGDNTRFLKDAFSELEEAQTALLTFVDSIKDDPQTHESLQQLKQRLDSLDMKFLREEIPLAIAQSLDGINRVAEIVLSMKNFAHPGTQTKQLSDLNQGIQSTTVVSRNVWKYIAKLQTEFDPKLPQINCTPGEINQVILNLIVNAAHAIEEKQKATQNDAPGLITFTTQMADQHVRIQVKDTGNGIPESIIARVFDPFTTTKAVGHGTGQGLAIAHTVVVDKHQGKISIETEVGVGTTFTILLPIDSELSKNNNEDEPQQLPITSQQTGGE